MRDVSSVVTYRGSVVALRIIILGFRAAALERSRVLAVIERFQPAIAQLAIEGQPLVMQFGGQTGKLLS